MVDDRDEFLWVVVSEDDTPSVSGSKGSGNLRDGLMEKLAAARRVSVVELEQRMSQFLLVVGRLFQQAEQQAQLTAAQSPGKTSQLKLDEVEMSIDPRRHARGSRRSTRRRAPVSRRSGRPPAR